MPNSQTLGPPCQPPLPKTDPAERSLSLVPDSKDTLDCITMAAGPLLPKSARGPDSSQFPGIDAPALWVQPGHGA